MTYLNMDDVDDIGQYRGLRVSWGIRVSGSQGILGSQGLRVSWGREVSGYQDLLRSWGLGVLGYLMCS